MVNVCYNSYVSDIHNCLLLFHRRMVLHYAVTPLNFKRRRYVNSTGGASERCDYCVTSFGASIGRPFCHTLVPYIIGHHADKWQYASSISSQYPTIRYSAIM